MKNSIKMNIGIIVSIFLFIIIPFAAGYDTDSKNLGNGANIVFVDINNPSCSDSYTRTQALDGTTPWCTLDAPLTKGKIQSGDTLYIAKGEYNGESDISGRTITKNITISAYPGDTVSLTRYYTGGKTTVPNSLWTSNGNNIWYTTLSSSTVSRPAVYYKDMTKFFTWNSKASFTASKYPENSYYESSTKRLYVKFSSSINPNNVPIYIASDYQPLYITRNTMSTGAYIIIKNLNFQYIYYGIHLVDQSNVVIENCKIYGGYNGISVDGQDNPKTKNIIIRNNYLNGRQNPVWYGEDMKNNYMEETSGLYVQDFAGRIEAYNNLFTYWHGGILLGTDSPKECDNSEISYNNFTYGRGSQIEIEKYCCNTKYHHNTFSDNTYAGVSFAPANADAGQCNFSYNIIVSKGKQRWSSSLDYDNYAIKAQSRSSSNVSNWIIDHNTFYGFGRALNTMSLEGGNLAGAWAKTTWTNNIFYAETEYVLFRTGLANSKVYFNNNLYYIKSGADGFIQRWNANSAMGYATLAAAKASSLWDGKWDTKSVQADPLFTNLVGNNLKPKSGSPACKLSTTGGYVGAIPC